MKPPREIDGTTDRPRAVAALGDHELAQLLDDLRLERDRRLNGERPYYFLKVTEAQAEDLAAGYVPNVVKAEARLLLDLEAEDARRAARPVKASEHVGKTRGERRRRVAGVDRVVATRRRRSDNRVRRRARVQPK